MQAEKDFASFLLVKFLPEKPLLQQQLNDSVVTRMCGCGCPTFDLWEAGCPAPPAGEARVFWQGIGETAKGHTVGILLFQTQDRLSCCEIFYYADESHADLPVLDSVKECQPLPVKI